MGESKHSLLPVSRPIEALVPRDGAGHQFVCYADSCSGVAGAPHEANFAAINTIVARLSPPPEFICFPGDEISGLTAADEVLRRQWHYWLEQEMAWPTRTRASDGRVVKPCAGTQPTLMVRTCVATR